MWRCLQKEAFPDTGRSSKTTPTATLSHRWGARPVVALAAYVEYKKAVVVHDTRSVATFQPYTQSPREAPRCESLVALLGTDSVLLPGSTGYNTTLSSYFTPQASAVHPLCFVTPHTATDVSDVVKSLSSTGDCIFAIRSGGHTWFPDASNAPSGVTIDLRGLNSIDVNAENSSACVGIGNTWDSVYTKLDSLGLSVAGGRVAGVGVGGLTLGGGISYFGPQHGWTCNQAISFEVVLANGSIVEANEQHNSELWWGLRGGSNNFGIVTRVTLATSSRIAAPQNYNTNASFFFGWGISQPAGQTVPIALNALVYTQPEENENPAVYQDILDLPSLTALDVTVANISTLSEQGAASQPPQVSRYLTATTTFVPTEAMILAAFDAYNNSVKSIQNLTGVSWSLIIEPVPPQTYLRGASKNALGLGDRTDTLAIYTAARAVMEVIEAKAKALGAYDPYIYLNYAAPWQEVIASYGEASVSRLQRLRANVDPSEVFTRLVPGGFKVPST
ncbi:Bifunctional solanapyrone synthase [Lachnellula subtilissima]|uniref:Bifunctional solanapyrone synthase n=1 Tax=Lachnellula subtilissima TaxID=602034 RepID=A0A8H8RS71_9HELO|nr:Bifunctional solanapyrone synthase [Lachnellula subtilissima]